MKFQGTIHKVGKARTTLLHQHRYLGQWCFCGQDDIRPPPTKTPLTLQSMSGHVIVSSNLLIDIASDMIPVHLLDFLKDLAQRANNRHAIQSLLVNDSVTTDTYGLDWLTGACCTEAHCSAMLARCPGFDSRAQITVQNFIQCVREREDNRMKLRRLVNRDHVLGDFVINQLANQVLVFNEERTKILKSRNSETNQPIDNVTDPFEVVLEAQVESIVTVVGVSRVLDVSNDAQSLLKLRLSKVLLDFSRSPLSYSHSSVVMQLLRKINTEFCVGLQLVNESLHTVVLKTEFLPVLKRFTNLRILDLSMNFGSLEDPMTLDYLVDTLRDLTKIKRLSLRHLSVSGALQKILSVLESPLEILQLSNCQPKSSDLDYLTVSHHADFLEELTFEDDLHGGELDSLLALLHRLRRTLVRLELTSINLSAFQFEQLFEACPRLERLEYLNVYPNRSIRRSSILNSLPLFASTPKLRVVIFKLPDEFPETANSNASLSCRLNHEMDQLCVKIGRPFVNLVFKR